MSAPESSSPLLVQLALANAVPAPAPARPTIPSPPPLLALLSRSTGGGRRRCLFVCINFASASSRIIRPTFSSAAKSNSQPPPPPLSRIDSRRTELRRSVAAIMLRDNLRGFGGDSCCCCFTIPTLLFFPFLLPFFSRCKLHARKGSCSPPSPPPLPSKDFLLKIDALILEIALRRLSGGGRGRATSPSTSPSPSLLRPPATCSKNALLREYAGCDGSGNPWTVSIIGGFPCILLIRCGPAAVSQSGR